jgi:hypothetical protein
MIGYLIALAGCIYLALAVACEKSERVRRMFGGEE